MYKFKSRIFVGDFETTVYKGQEDTEVWASACVELGTEDVKIFHSIDEQYEYFLSLKSNLTVYYHNLKFDGAFWLSYLMVDLGYKSAYNFDPDDINNGSWIPQKDMKNKTFTYVISDMGQWYNITIKDKGRFIQIRDSLKLLPFSVKRIGSSFGTSHKKLEMEYKGFRYAGCEITDEEKKYMANDVLVVKEALEIMFNEGHNKLTIGSCCLSEFKKGFCKEDYQAFFPDLYEKEINPLEHKYNSVGEWIKKSYRGGWCYLAKGKENKVYKNGITADVNSLYPSMMSSESGNAYPIGLPTFWHGNFIPDKALTSNRYYFIRINTRFYLKEGKLPFIQVKNNLMYKATQMLETSDIYNSEDGRYYKEYIGVDGKLHPAILELTMTCTDFELFKEHYNLVDFEILDGCYFYSMVGIFDEYIDHYKRIKLESKGAKRELAKLFLNNLYGKMASSTVSNYKLAYVKEDRSIGFYTVLANDKKAGYIPIGSAITSYARNFTIRAAQANYDGFIYADTDSIHCNLPPNKIKGIKVDPKEFCCWKLESTWDEAIFIRQKTYIEHVVQEDLEECTPYYNIKCAGMPDRCKELFLHSMLGTMPENATEEEKEFCEVKRNITDFKVGLKVPSKLLPKRIRGGVVLVDTYYEMR